MSLAANELQKALYARLTAQLAGTPVYDHVPQATAYPYVRLGSLTALPWDTKTEDGQEYTVTIHAFAQGAGKKSVQALMQTIYAALHHQEASLTLTGFTVVVLRCEFSEADVEPMTDAAPDRDQHGVLRFRALVATD